MGNYKCNLSYYVQIKIIGCQQLSLKLVKNKNLEQTPHSW